MKIRVRNFQTAKDTTIEAKGFTVVVGKSNTGKTSILRAVEASLFNDSITGCIRHGEKETCVDVELPSLSYTWEKGENKNGYNITTPTGTKEYSKVGFQVPTEIEGLGFKEFRIEGEAQPIRPQFAEWHNPIFLLNKTGKVITELMASVTRLDVINMSIRKCSTNLRRDRSTLKVREDDLKKAKRRSLEFDVLDDIAAPSIEKTYQACAALEAQLSEVASYITKMDALQSSIAKVSVLTQAQVPEPFPSDFDKKAREVATYITKLDPVQRGLAALKGVEDVQLPTPIPTEDAANLATVAAWLVRLDALNKRAGYTQVLDTVQIPDSNLGDLLGQVLAATAFHTSLQKHKKDVLDVRQEVSGLETQIETDGTQLGLLRGQIDTCPVCGRDDHV